MGCHIKDSGVSPVSGTSRGGLQSVLDMPLSTVHRTEWVCRADSIDGCHVTKMYLEKGKNKSAY